MAARPPAPITLLAVLLWVAVAACAGSPESREYGVMGRGGSLSFSSEAGDGRIWAVQAGPDDLSLLVGQSRVVLAGFIDGRGMRWKCQPGDLPAWRFLVDGRPEVSWCGLALRVGEREYVLADPGVVHIGPDGEVKALSASGR